MDVSNPHAPLALSFCGRNFLFDHLDGNDQIGHQIQSGEFECPLPLFVMASLCRLGGAFIDVGANSGLYTVLACKAAENINVIAFEPFPVAIRSLKRNIDINDIGNRVTFFNMGLSNTNTTSVLYIPENSTDILETSCSLEADFKETHKGTLQIETRTLDSLAIKQKISVIKVDIEGHEHAFLEGAQETILQNRPIIFIEVLDGAKKEFHQKFLSTAGYKDFRLRPEMAILDYAVRFDGKAWNHAFVPNDKIDVFLECCRAHTIEVCTRMM
ncbi:FkbM family methyltransferase [Acetobacter conturbans]|uniref:FkbM family methyltransferase n=1 Tax=Acetobacter conturbans TaxID=1737472 RepID=UPI0015686BF1